MTLQLAEADQTGLTFRPIAYSFGMDVDGLDVSQQISEAQAERLREALDEHKVLALRNQLKVSPPALHRFASIFGKPEEAPHPTFPDHPDQIGVKVLTSDAKQRGSIADSWHKSGITDTWHTDGSTRECTRCVTVLQAVDVPDVGRDTVFADMEAIYEDLSDAMKQLLEGLMALNSWGWQNPDAPPVEHPVVLVNPRNGRKSLYVNRAYTNSFIGMREDECEALRNFLLEQTHKPEYQLRLHWEPGTIAIWNNETTQHYLVLDRAYPRVMHRCMMF
ncbi:MAG: TauD/TfdA family dioxygenase [Novosphingobium sp.]